jgi:hypothetical protein
MLARITHLGGTELYATNMRMKRMVKKPQNIEIKRAHGPMRKKKHDLS